MNETTNNTESEQANTIAADALCSLSGLSDRRHRQLAAQGFFPPPIRSRYQRSETLKGLFRYFREAQERAGATLKKEEEGYARAKRRRSEIELEMLLKSIVPIDDVMFIWADLTERIKQRMYAVPRNMARELEGKTAGQIDELLHKEMDQVILDVRQVWEHKETREAILDQSPSVLKGGFKPTADEHDDTNETDS